MSASAKSLRVRVTDLKTGNPKANVTIPIGLANFGLKMGAKFAPAECEGLDMEQIISAAQSGEKGKLVDVQDEAKGEHVEVFVE